MNKTHLLAPVLDGKREAKPGDYLRWQVSALHVYSSGPEECIDTVLRLREDPKVRIDPQASGFDSREDLERILGIEKFDSLLDKMKNSTSRARTEKIEGEFIIKIVDEGTAYMLFGCELEEYEAEVKPIKDALLEKAAFAVREMENGRYETAIRCLLENKKTLNSRVERGYMTLAQDLDVKLMEAEAQVAVKLLESIKQDEKVMYEMPASADKENILTKEFYQKPRRMAERLVNMYKTLHKQFNNQEIEPASKEKVAEALDHIEGFTDILGMFEQSSLKMINARRAYDTAKSYIEKGNGSTQSKMYREMAAKKMVNLANGIIEIDQCIRWTEILKERFPGKFVHITKTFEESSTAAFYEMASWFESHETPQKAKDKAMPVISTRRKRTITTLCPELRRCMGLQGY